MTDAALEQRLGHRFSRPELLRQALTHRSYGTPNNERLEFLGDSVLNCVIATAIYDRFDHLKEGELSRLRASLVCQDALHGIAAALDLGACLLLGEGELKSGGQRRPSILADALEALFAAVFLDAGFDTAREVILRLYGERLAETGLGESLKDPKTRLQEWLQARRLGLPAYQLRGTRGEAHAQEFEVECRVPVGELVTVGHGTSRRSAEQEAARLAYQELCRP